MQGNLFNNKIIVSSFQYSRKEFIKIIRQLKKPARIRSTEFHFVKCEMIIEEGKVTIRLSGSEVYLKCDTFGVCKSTFFLRDFYEAIKSDKGEIISVEVGMKTINVNVVTLSSLTILFSESSRKKEIEIPLSFLNRTIREEEEHYTDPNKTRVIKLRNIA